MERFDDYWQKDKGYPYLDKLIYKTVGDALVARAMMEAGQADTWESPSDPTIFPEMEKKGFKAKYTGHPLNGLQWFLYPEVKPDSIFNDLKVRQAIACALDTEGIAMSIEKGIYDPLNQLVCKGLYSYNPDFHSNDYNLDKAKQLLAASGHPNGFDTTLTYEPGEKDDAVAIADCLKKVGINVKLNMVSFGSFFQTAMTGWDGLMLLFSGVGNDMYGISSFNTWLGPTRSIPFQMRDWSPKVLSLLNQGLYTYDPEARKDIAKQLFTAAAEELNVIPVYQRPNAVLYQSWVHSDFPEDGGIQYRHIYKVWMDPH
jgi:peptide/nickel transport system substrate-binding protein